MGAVSEADDQPDRNAVVGHLNAIISWYRDASANVQPGELPSDAIFQQNVRSLAMQAVQLAFQSARAEAALLGESNESNAGGAPQDYTQVEARVSQHLADDQSELDALNKQTPAQSGAKRKSSLVQRDRLAGQIGLDKAMLGAIQKMSSFVELNTVSKQGLEGSIDELANSVPEVVAPHSGTAAKRPSQTVSPTTVKSSGLIGELVTLYAQVQTIRTINRMLAENARVSANRHYPARTAACIDSRDHRTRTTGPVASRGWQRRNAAGRFFATHEAIRPTLFSSFAAESRIACVGRKPVEPPAMAQLDFERIEARFDRVAFSRLRNWGCFGDRVGPFGDLAKAYIPLRS